MANFLKSLFIKGVEIDTAGASTGNVLSYNGTKFAPAAPGSGSLALDDLSDVVVTSPEEFQGLSYNGVSWVNNHIPLVSYVRNAESTTITTGTCVYLFGATGDHATVKRADNNNDSTSAKTIGVAGANITASNNGPVVTRGYVDGIDLSSGYTAGDVLWLGENGAFTTTKPTAPDHLVFIGVVVRATNNGIIYVATQNGYELDELHNVSLPSPNSGEFLKYNGSLWVADAIDLGTDTTGNYMSGISGTSPVSVAHTPSEGSSATVSLANEYGDTQNPYGSKTANTFLAAPNGSNGAPSFRAIAVADVPTLNQNTTGTASNITASSNTTLTSLSNLVTVGTITSGTWSGSFGSVSGANLTSLNASNLGSGTVPSARISGSYSGITSVGTLSGLAVAGNISSQSVTNGDTIQISPVISGTENRVLILTNAPLGATRTITFPNATGTVITTGNLTGITTVGTLTAGSIPATLLTGTVDTARISGSYTGITAVGTLSSLTVDGFNGPSVIIGDWSGNGAFSGVTGTRGYLLLGHATEETVYLRATGASAKVRLGGNSSDTVIIGNSITNVTGNLTTGNATTNNSTLNVNGGTAWFSSMGTGSGTTVLNSFGFLVMTSSRRELKENIVTVNSSESLQRLLALRPVEFTMKPEYVHFANDLTPFDKKRGFIAQEVAEVDHWYGQWGWVDEDQKMQTQGAIDGSLPLEESTPVYWNHDAVIADLVATIQNLNARLAVLESTQ
jgi:hypothetical protein